LIFIAALKQTLSPLFQKKKPLTRSGFFEATLLGSAT
jgi:hypothetical protein